MALFHRFYNPKQPDRLLEVSERVYVFDCCFSTDLLDKDAYKEYLDGVVVQLQDCCPDASFMAVNFREGDWRSPISDILSHYNMTVMEYPRQYENCALLPLETISHFLQCSESWLSTDGQQNVLLLHCERGAWPVLAFMLAAFLLDTKQYSSLCSEYRTLEMFYKQAPKELLRVLSPMNPQPSQMRYLEYISGRAAGSEWPPLDTPLIVDCFILRSPPLLGAGKGFRPVLRVYGQDPSVKSCKCTKLLFSSSMEQKHIGEYDEVDHMKLDVRCRVQGDVVLECVNWCDTKEEMMFRVMFNTAFVGSNALLLTRDAVDTMWDARDQFPMNFYAVVHFSDADASPCISTDAESEAENDADNTEEIYSNGVDGKARTATPQTAVLEVGAKSDSEMSLERRVQTLESQVHALKEDVRILKEAGYSWVVNGEQSWTDISGIQLISRDSLLSLLMVLFFVGVCLW